MEVQSGPKASLRLGPVRPIPNQLIVIPNTPLLYLLFVVVKRMAWCEIASSFVYPRCVCTLYIQQADVHFAETDPISGGVNENRTASESSAYL